MRAERHPAGSTGGTAPAYHAPMRNATLLTIGLFLSPLACSEDAPTRPEDGTVQLWDECVWEGQFERELCEPQLACAWNGICVPRCTDLDQCTFDGFESRCESDAGEDVCKVRCNEEKECPQTGGVALRCSDAFCTRDP